VLAAAGQSVAATGQSLVASDRRWQRVLPAGRWEQGLDVSAGLDVLTFWE
jgi:hypothetical protein